MFYVSLKGLRSLYHKNLVSAFGVKKGGVCLEGAHAAKIFLPRLSLAAQPMYDVPISHTCSARDLTGTKLDLTCVEKVLGMYQFDPCLLRICTHRGH
jgi:hypothetical protein